MTRPKICDITGTEVGEVFAVRKADGGTYDAEVTEYGYIAFAGTHELLGGDYVCDIYNGKATIERKPRFRAYELYTLQLLWEYGIQWAARDGDGALWVYYDRPCKGAKDYRVLVCDASGIKVTSADGDVFAYALPHFLFPRIRWTDTEPLDIAATLRAARMEVE